jgi:hypothetical protein
MGGDRIMSSDHQNGNVNGNVNGNETHAECGVLRREWNKRSAPQNLGIVFSTRNWSSASSNAQRNWRRSVNGQNKA